MKKVLSISIVLFLSLNLGIICMTLTTATAAPGPGGGGGSNCPNIGSLQAEKRTVNNGDVCSCPNDSKLYAINTCNAYPLVHDKNFITL
jgi:hypothetical protein